MNSIQNEPVDTVAADDHASAGSVPPMLEAFSTVLCAALGFIGYAMKWIPAPHAHEYAILPLAAAYIAGGWLTLKAAFQSLRNGELNVDTLMLIAAIGAAILGDWVEGVVLLFLFSLSGTLEKFASYRTNRSIESLIQLRPKTANLVLAASSIDTPNGTPIDLNSVTSEDKVVAIEALEIGDVIRVKSGERFPIDGLVVDGESWADESTLTGESRPISKKLGSEVYSGTMNTQGSILIRMTKRIADSTIERIVKLVHDAQSQKTPAQKFVESWQQPYVIAVLAAALFTLLGTRWFHTVSWQDSFYHAMVILVAASPCAVVLSSPSVMLSAIALAGRYGVLVKGAASLEQIGMIDAIALDKTGTITLGKPKVAEVWLPDADRLMTLLQMAAVVEKQSEHPLAAPIIEELERRGGTLTVSTAREFHSHTGLGVHGVVDGVWVGIGREKLFDSHDIPFPRELSEQSDRMRSLGMTAIPILTSTPGLYGVIGVADPLRAEALQALRGLKSIGVPKIALLTGDHESVAIAVSKGLPIDEIHAGLMPEDKVKQLRKLRDAGHRIAMVGDGVNDAPALAAADVGIAMGGGGTDVALEVADVVLMRDDLRSLTTAIWIARTAHARVKQNIYFAFGMIGLLVLASFFNLPMWLGVLGHEGSTLIVVYNGVRMLWSKIPNSEAT